MSLLDVYTTVFPRLLVNITSLLLIVLAAAMLLFEQKLTKSVVPMLALVCVTTFTASYPELAFIITFVSACLTAIWFRKHHFGSLFLYWLALVALGPVISVVTTLMILSIGSFEYEPIINRIWNLVFPVAIPTLIWVVILGTAGITKPKPTSPI